MDTVVRFYSVLFSSFYSTNSYWVHSGNEGCSSTEKAIRGQWSEQRGEISKSQIRHGLLGHVYVGHTFYVPSWLSSWTSSCLLYLSYHCICLTPLGPLSEANYVSCPYSSRFSSFAIVMFLGQPAMNIWSFWLLLYFCTWRKPRPQDMGFGT